jgi:hypothetical protein
MTFKCDIVESRSDYSGRVEQNRDTFALSPTHSSVQNLLTGRNAANVMHAYISVIKPYANHQLAAMIMIALLLDFSMQDSIVPSVR